MTAQWNHVTWCSQSANTELAPENIPPEGDVQSAGTHPPLQWELLFQERERGAVGGLPLTPTWRLFPGWTPTLPVSSRRQCPEERDTLSAKAPAPREVARGVRTASGINYICQAGPSKSCPVVVRKDLFCSHQPGLTAENLTRGQTHKPNRQNWSTNRAAQTVSLDFWQRFQDNSMGKGKINVLKHWLATCKNTNLNPDLTHKWITDPNGRAKTITFLEENTGENLYHFGKRRHFLGH